MHACCLTLVRGLGVAETFLRLGAGASVGRVVGFDELVRTADDERALRPQRQLAGAVALDGWTLLLEPDGYACSEPPFARRLSAGTTAVTLYHGCGDGDDDGDELSVTTDGHRSHRFDVRAHGCHLATGPLCVDPYWSTSGPALVERFSGVRLSAGLVHELTYRTGSLALDERRSTSW